LCIDNRKNLLSGAAQNNPPFLAVIAGNVRMLKPASILKDFTCYEKRNTVLAQVDLSLRGIPIELHEKRIPQIYL
jgi:hypothetical protein